MKTVKAKLYFLIGLSVFFLSTLSVTGVYVAHQYDGLIDEVIHSKYYTISSLDNVQEKLLESRIYWRETITSFDESKYGVKVTFANRDSYKKALEAETIASKILEEINSKKGIFDNDDERRFKEILTLMREYEKIATQLYASVRAGTLDLNAIYPIVQARDKVLTAVREFNDHKHKEFEIMHEESEKLKHNSTHMLGWATAICALLLLAITTYINRSIIASLYTARLAANKIADGDFTGKSECLKSCRTGRDAGCDGTQCEIGQVNLAINKVRDQMHQSLSLIQAKANEAGVFAETLATNASEAKNATQIQSDRTMNVSASTEELSVSVHEIAESVKTALASIQDSIKLANNGIGLMEKSQNAILLISSSTEQSAKVMADLKTSTTDIQDLTKVIKEIAGQTNLLALNAAIEAARAGDQGRGFAVVADEVRKLAEKTTQTSNMIEELAAGMGQRVHAMDDSVKAITESTSNGTDYITETRQVLEQTVAQVNGVGEQIKMIEHATSEQQMVANTVAGAMEETAAATEENSVSISNIDSTARDLHNLSKDLTDAVKIFRV